MARGPGWSKTERKSKGEPLEICSKVTLAEQRQGIPGQGKAKLTPLRLLGRDNPCVLVPMFLMSVPHTPHSLTGFHRDIFMVMTVVGGLVSPTLLAVQIISGSTMGCSAVLCFPWLGARRGLARWLSSGSLPRHAGEEEPTAAARSPCLLGCGTDTTLGLGICRLPV